MWQCLFEIFYRSSVVAFLLDSQRIHKERILSLAFLTGVRVSRGTPLSILVRRPHKELCPREPPRPEEKTKDVGESGVKLRNRESLIQVQEAGLVSRL